MWKKNVLLGVLTLAVASVAGFSQGENVSAQDSQYRAFVGCTPLTTAQRTAAIDNLDERLVAMGIPKTISDPYGRAITHSINVNHMLNDCMVVYGGPSDVPTNTVYPGTKMKQTYGASGKPIFIGFDANKNLYPSSIESTNPADEKYFNNRKFIKNPWNSTAKWSEASHTLASSISASAVKPVPRALSYASTKTVDETKLTEVQELARVNDFIYWQNSDHSRGKIGYLRAWNGNTGVTWSANELYNYASVEYFPSEYTPGVFNVYSWAENDVYFYSTNVIPQHKMPLRELKSNLKIEVTSMSTATVDEGGSVTVNFKVTNTAQLKVVKPIVSYYTQGKTPTNITLNTTLNPNGVATGSFTVTAPSVSANKVERVFVEVNKNRKNPLDESTYSDNIDSEYFGIVNARSGGGINITNHTPVNPRSNENTTFTYKICNTGTNNMTNVQTYLNWPRASKEAATLFPLIRGEVTTFDQISKTFSTTPGQCVTGTKAVPAPDTAEVEKTTTMTATTNNGLSGTRPVTVRNPNASLKITNHKQDTTINEKEIGDLKATVTNEMFKTINQSCLTSGGCKPTPESTTFNIKFFDVTDGTPNEITTAAFSATYSLTHGNSKTFDLTASKAALMAYIGNNKKITTFKVQGYIPYYAGEYDVHGAPMYEDNKEIFEIQYLPPRPDVTNASCNVLEHSTVGFFNTGTGPSLVKACMGHFPNNPSTLVEKGMQSYNYVLYRFTPMPLPKYDVYSPELNKKNPNYFYQVINTPNDNRVQGDAKSYIFKNQVSGVYKERGRYLPTKVNFDFKINNMTDNETSKKKIIAAGNVDYTIPATCYETNKLDLKYYYGCGEIMIFLPNTYDNLLEIPADYSSAAIEDRQISYPIADSKIPYLNPGKYKFELKATETYKYYSQKNNNYDPGTYNWSNIVAN